MFPILTHTPIKEIILTIAFDGLVNENMLEQFKNLEFVKQRLPFSNPTFNTSLKLGSSDSKLLEPTKSEGFFLKNAEIPDRALHIRIGSMTLHLLNKYESLNALIKELEGYWLELTKIATEITVNNISVRYLNLIVKDGEEPIEHYVTIYPHHPFNDTRINTFTNIRFDLQNAIVTLNLTEGKIRDEKGIILDYTINKNIEPNTENFFKTFNELRDLKNTVFFKSITEHTVKIYQS